LSSEFRVRSNKPKSKRPDQQTQIGVSELRTKYSKLIYFEPQVEQLWEEQLPQEELDVVFIFPPTEKAKADILRWTFLLLHSGQLIFSEELKINFSNS
jgi:hypothetical protein